jgi:predicted nucleic acid-binding protein
MSTASLDDVPSGARVFLDASIFVYHFSERSLQCRRLLRRCEQRDVVGVTSVVAFNEASHRLLILEAVQSGVVSSGNVLRKLRRRPDLACQLRLHVVQMQCVPAWGIDVLPLDLGRSLRAAAARSTTGLLTNDSLLLATMTDEAIRAIATADADFDRFGDLQIFRPTDLNAAAPALA